MTIPILVVTLMGVLAVAAIIGVTIGTSIVRSKRADEAKSWPTTDGTVRGSGMAAIDRYSGKVPWFDFSYVVDGEYYSGTFALRIHGDRAETMLGDMDGRKVNVRYDPARPSRFYVVDETIAECEVILRSGASS